MLLRVAIDPAPIKGIVFLPPSALRVASIALRNPGNRKRAVALSREQFRYGFGNAVSEEESDELYDRWAIPSPGKPLFEAAFANFSPGSPAKVNTKNSARGPLLVTAHGRGSHHSSRCLALDAQAVPQVERDHGLAGVPGTAATPSRSTRVGARWPTPSLPG